MVREYRPRLATNSPSRINPCSQNWLAPGLELGASALLAASGCFGCLTFFFSGMDNKALHTCQTPLSQPVNPPLPGAFANPWFRRPQTFMERRQAKRDAAVPAGIALPK